MNNKQIGTEFEQEFCKRMSAKGFWVHFLVPDARGAQPFDVIAAKKGKTLVFDCKTCKANTFNISRLEDNQISAFDLWLKCGNSEPMIAVKHNEDIIIIGYSYLKKNKSVKLDRTSPCVFL